MKNNITKAFTNIIYFGILYLLGYSGYGQIQKDPDSQGFDIHKAMEHYREYYMKNDRLTMAALQIPETNVWLISSNNPNINPADTARNAADVKESLTSVHGGSFQENWYYKGQWHPMTIGFVSGTIQGDVGLYEDIKDENDVIDHSVIQLPSRNNIHLHAEMALVSALSIFYNYVYNKPMSAYLDRDKKDWWVINSSREFCPRCFGYLRASGCFYTPELNTLNVQDRTYASKDRWSVPGYTLSDNSNTQMNRGWDPLIRIFVANYARAYLDPYPSHGVFTGDRFSLKHDLGHEAFPEQLNIINWDTLGEFDYDEPGY